MDFHAVAEALVDGAWRVVDATLLAPRASLIRIAPAATRPTPRSCPATVAPSSW